MPACAPPPYSLPQRRPLSVVTANLSSLGPHEFPFERQPLAESDRTATAFARQIRSYQYRSGVATALAVGIESIREHRAPKVFSRFDNVGLRNLSLEFVGGHSVARGRQISILRQSMNTSSEPCKFVDEYLSVSAAVDDLDAMPEISAELDHQTHPGCRDAAQLPRAIDILRASGVRHVIRVEPAGYLGYRFIGQITESLEIMRSVHGKTEITCGYDHGS